MTDFKLPELGENITTGTIVAVRVKPGDSVTKNQTIFEIETNKATIEVPSPLAGVIKEILVKSGEEAKVGQVLLKFEEQGASSQDQGIEKQEARSQRQEVKEQGASSKEQESEKQEARSKKQEIAGQVASGKEQENVTPGTTIADVAASPSVRRLAREIGVEISDVTPSGPNGHILEEDVKAHAKKLLTSRASGAGLSFAEPPLPDFSRWGEISREPLSHLRKAASEHLSLSWRTIPHVTHFEKVDITQLENVRKKYSTAEQKLTITPFIIKVVTAALKHFPKFNASLDSAKNEIILKKYIHIGLAVDTPHGLMVPVVRDADQKGVLQLHNEISTLAQKAREKKLTLDEMQGSSFTVTNLGGIGGIGFTPIINYPEVAILGIARAHLEPNYKEGERLCSPALMLPLSLSYDHRLIDGADGARFLRWIADAIEQPFILELEK